MSYIVTAKQTIDSIEDMEKLTISTEIEVSAKISTVQIVPPSKVTLVAEFGKKVKIEGLENLRKYGSVLTKAVEKKVQEDFPMTEKLNDLKARSEQAAQNTQGGGEENTPVSDNETRDIEPQAEPIEEVVANKIVEEPIEKVEETTEVAEETAPKAKKKK